MRNNFRHLFWSQDNVVIEFLIRSLIFRRRLFYLRVKQMALRAEFSLINSELNEFLYALIGEEDGGTELTVLSALTRLALDPWGEAARLSTLPRSTAASALAVLIARLPGGRWEKSDVPAIAARLVQLLPGSIVAPASDRSDSASKRKNSAAVVWLIALILCAGLFGVWSRRTEQAPPPVSASHSSQQEHDLP
jgi:hypothetical protein